MIHEIHGSEGLGRTVRDFTGISETVQWLIDCAGLSDAFRWSYELCRAPRNCWTVHQLHDFARPQEGFVRSM